MDEQHYLIIYQNLNIKQTNDENNLKVNILKF